MPLGRLGRFGDTQLDTTGLSPDIVAALNQLPATSSQPQDLSTYLTNLVTGFEQARVYNAATNAQISQLNQLAGINPAWILVGLGVILFALARR